MELHGGTIEARSDGLGKGSELVVRIPTLSAQSLRTPAADGSETHAPSRRILVADDNPDAVDSLVMLLEAAGHQVRGVEDGEAAVAAARDFLPDVVLLDIGMPRLNGYEAARQIRAEDWGREMFLVALTGWGQDSDREHARDAGFDVHLVKPVDPRLLHRVVAGTAPASAPR
jgi:CheY-like chemotaxis protein